MKFLGFCFILNSRRKCRIPPNSERQKSWLNVLKYSPKTPKFVSGIFRNLENFEANLPLIRTIFGDFAPADDVDFVAICPENAAFSLRFTPYFTQKLSTASSAQSATFLHRHQENPECRITKSASTPGQNSKPKFEENCSAVFNNGSAGTCIMPLFAALPFSQPASALPEAAPKLPRSAAPLSQAAPSRLPTFVRDLQLIFKYLQREFQL